MLTHSTEGAGGLPVWTVLVLTLLSLSVLFLRPFPEGPTTLGDTLGVETPITVRPI